MDKRSSNLTNAPTLLALALGAMAVLALVTAGAANVSAQSRGKPAPPQKPLDPNSAQIIYGFPLTVTVEDDTQMDIRYSNAALDQDEAQQFYGPDAEGVYIWANVSGVTTVFGPPHVPAGRDVNAYTPVSNIKTGSGSPSDPWVITTVNNVTNTNLRLTQRTSYVNGAEFVSLLFTVQQIGGSGPITATVFHAADLYTGNSDLGYGYYDSSTGGVGDYFTPTTRTLFQQFVPNSSLQAPAAYEEDFYSTIWGDIGDLSGPGDGFHNTIISNTLHDSGAGLQWNLSIPASGAVTIGDTDLFSVHQSLCGSFSDVHFGDFAYEHVYYLACNGIVSGYSDTTYRPGLNITRGQLSKIVSNSAGLTGTPSGQTFTDVPPSNPFYVYIERLYTAGAIGGYNCGTVPTEPCDSQNRPYFRWSNNANRGQISKIISEAKGLTGTPTGQTFTDVPPSNTFYLFVERLYATGAISGYLCGGPGEPCDPQNRPYFRWQNNATRAQTAKIDANTFFPGCCAARP
jgi:hypothetical protein